MPCRSRSEGDGNADPYRTALNREDRGLMISQPPQQGIPSIPFGYSQYRPCCVKHHCRQAVSWQAEGHGSAFG